MVKEPFEFKIPKFKKLHKCLLKGKSCIAEVTPAECGILWAGIPQEEVDQMVDEINKDNTREYIICDGN